MDKIAFNKMHGLAAKDKEEGKDKDLTAFAHIDNKEMTEDTKIDIKKEVEEETKSSAMPITENRIWKCVSGADQIRKVVEHLGEEGQNLDQDLELRNNLVTSLLSVRKVADSSGG